MMRGKNRKPSLRLDGLSSFLSSVIAIAVGLVFGFIILLISNPAQAVNGLMVIIKGGFNGGAKGVGQMLYYATPLILTGLSVGFAFKTGLFNIGASGQLITGALAAMIVGGLWAAVPGLFKAFLGVNEVIACIMMNYIGMYGVN